MMLPYVIEQTIQGERSYDIHSRLLADHIVKTKQKLNKIYAENTSQSIEQIEKDTDRDNFMSAAEAKEYGLIDGILEHRGIRV